jgi:glycerol-3-phosphate acyltransferase PlsX
MRIIVDGMGGDEAPAKIVDGVVLAAKEFQSRGEDHQVVVTGDKEQILARISHCEGDALVGKYIQIVHTDEWIAMGESPTAALAKKTRSSVHIGVDMVKRGEAQAFISMGNTGAVMAVGLMGLGRIEGVARPTIGAFFPSANAQGFTLLLDVGANMDCRPDHLLQFGVMGNAYMQVMMNIQHPKVGLLSVGEEDNKGDDLTIKVNELFRQKKLFKFIGNVEGRDILKGTADVVVCDGFTGNVALKLAESVLDFLKIKFRAFAKTNLWNGLLMAMVAPGMRRALKHMDYQSHGGVPLLGVNGVVIIGHGSSSTEALLRAIHVAREMVEKRINDVIRERINKLS